MIDTEKLKTIRHAQGISQRALAAKAGVSFGSVQRAETSGFITLRTLTKLAEALGLPALVLLK